MDNRARIQLEDFDALFNGASSEMEQALFASGQCNQKSKYPIEEINICEIESFPDHPFKVVDDQEMSKLAESILTDGVLNPVILRKKSGSYQMISGHRRLYACKKIGLFTIPARVLNLDDDQATIIMIDANFLQRTIIHPSEKAKAYRKKYEAMKHQGKSGDSKDTYAEIGKATNESSKTVQRFCQLCNLSDDLLEMIDSKRIGLSSGFEFMYMSENSQKILKKYLEHTDIRIKKSQAKKIKEKSLNEEICEEDIELIINSEEQHITIALNEEKIRAYFPKETGIQEIENQIIELLKLWKEESNVL